MIPNRADTLRVLRLMGNNRPMLMLTGDEDGYGTRWTLEGQQVQPAIARYLMAEAMIAEMGSTDFGAKRLMLTAKGQEFKDEGLRWWAELNLLQKLKVTILG
jgi:hypothetical protein